jgi:hypothetical protein
MKICYITLTYAGYFYTLLAEYYDMLIEALIFAENEKDFSEIKVKMATGAVIFSLYCTSE